MIHLKQFEDIFKNIDYDDLEEDQEMEIGPEVGDWVYTKNGNILNITTKEPSATPNKFWYEYHSEYSNKDYPVSRSNILFWCKTKEELQNKINNINKFDL